MEAVLAAEVRVVALIQSSPLGFWPIGIIPPAVHVIGPPHRRPALLLIAQLLLAP
jgi:hypothetical protein